MKLFFLSLIFSVQSLASLPPCDGLPPNSIDQLDTSIAIPNCLTTRALLNARGPRRNSQTLCNCRSEFEQRAMLPSSPAITKSQKQEMYFEAMLKEYEKVQKNNLVDLVKLNALDPEGRLRFENSNNVCQFKTAESFTTGCRSSAARALFERSDIFNSFQERLSSEFINILGPLQNQPREGLLNRNSLYSNFSSQQCSLNESDALKFTSLALESLIAPDFINSIKSQGSRLNNKSLDEILDSTGFDTSLSGLIKQHPLLRLQMNPESRFLSFINSIPAPYSTQSLNQILTNQENSQLIDQKLADSCASSFNNLKSALCSDQFEAGDLELDPFANLSRLGVDIPQALPPTASTEEIVSLNQEVLRFCPWQRNESAQNLSETVLPFDELIDSSYHNLSDDEFSKEKYNREISSARDQICSKQNNTAPCETMGNFIDRHSCLAAQLWRQSSSTTTPPSAALSERPIAQLIRGFLPPIESLDARTRTELARIGIIPTPTAQRPSATQVAQAAAQTPRFNPQFTSSPNTNHPRGGDAVGTQTQTPQPLNTPTRSPAAAASSSSYSSQIAEVMAQKQRIFEESNETYRSVINELMKRRLDNPSREEITQAVTEEFRRTSTPFDPRSREGQSFINNIVNNYPQALNNNNPQAITRPFEQERVAQAFEEAITEINSAGSGSPASASARTDINSIATSAQLSVSPNGNGLTRVIVNDPALNLTDPQLPQLLQSVLTLNENGEVLQSMLDQRKDFILKLNNTEVMMTFDPSAGTYQIRPMGNVPGEVMASLTRFVNEYSVIARARENRHTTLSALMQELQQHQSSFQ